MAAGAWQVYGNAIETIAEGTIDLNASGTPRLRMILVDAAYTPTVDTDALYSDLGGNEVTGTGYTANGNLLTTTVTRSGSTVTFDCDDQSWANSTITAKYAVIVQDADADGSLVAGDLLVCYADLDDGGGSVSTTDGTFAVNINASGVFTLDRAA